MQSELSNFRSKGAQLVAISPELPDQSLSTAEQNELAFPLLSDVGNKVARAFGLVFTLPAELRPIYESFGIDVAGHNGDETFELPCPATYVIDASGKIEYAFVHSDYTLRAEPSDLLATLDRLKN